MRTRGGGHIAEKSEHSPQCSEDTNMWTFPSHAHAPYTPSSFLCLVLRLNLTTAVGVWRSRKSCSTLSNTPMIVCFLNTKRNQTLLHNDCTLHYRDSTTSRRHHRPGPAGFTECQSPLHRTSTAAPRADTHRRVQAAPHRVPSSVSGHIDEGRQAPTGASSGRTAECRQPF